MTPRSLLYHVGQLLTQILPHPACVQLAEGLADLHYRSSPRDRAAVHANLALVLGDAAGDPSQIARETFRNFARYLVEFFTVHHQRISVTIEGYERLTALRRLPQGGLILSGHLGNWELGAIVLRRLGFPMSVVALPHDDAGVNVLFNRQRLRCGVEIIPLGRRAAQRCLERLRGGAVLGIAGDREFGPNGISVSLFGQSVIMPRGPALLSLRTGAPVVPAFLIREGRGWFRFYIEPPIWPRRKAPGTPAGIQELTQAYATILERYIRRFPSQWIMFQPLTQAPPVQA